MNLRTVPFKRLLQCTTESSHIPRVYLSSDLNTRFNESKENSSKLNSDPGNEAKLQLYALYKQATVGPNTTDKPGSFDIVGKYKWAAWSKLGNMTQDEAKEEYIKLVDKLHQEHGSSK